VPEPFRLLGERGNDHADGMTEPGHRDPAGEIEDLRPSVA